MEALGSKPNQGQGLAERTVSVSFSLPYAVALCPAGIGHRKTASPFESRSPEDHINMDPLSPNFLNSGP